MLRRLFLFFFVLVPLFLTMAFYILSGSFFDTPHHNRLTNQWENYSPLLVDDSLKQNAEQAIALLNKGLTDEEERQLIQYFEIAQRQSKMNDFLQYLKNKKFQNRNALELLILRFDEAIYQRGFSVEFLWKATISSTTHLIAHPSLNSQQPNTHYLIDLLTVICLDSTLNVRYFEDVLQYNAYAWAWHNKRDNSRYQFDEVYNMQDMCLTQRTLLMLLPRFFAQPKKVNNAVWKRIYDLLEKPKCQRKGVFFDYSKERQKIQAIVEN